MGGAKRRTKRDIASYAYARTAELVSVLAEQEPRVRQSEPGSVHDMRVAVRRLDCVLRSYRRLFPASAVAAAHGDLKWLAQLLGVVRDGEVLRRRLDEARNALPEELVLGPVAARIEFELAPGLQQARRHLLSALDDPRYRRLTEALQDLAFGFGADDASQRTLSKGQVRRIVAAKERKVRRVDSSVHDLPPGPERDLRLHELRRTAKKARYTAEAASPLAGRHPRRVQREMKRLQSVLGDYHDTVVTRETLRGLGVQAYLAHENGFTFGLLYGLQRGEGEALLERFERLGR